MSLDSRHAGSESKPISEAVRLAAADWLARREGGLTVDEQAQFSGWLLADARHAAAVREIEASWRFLQRPRFTGQADLVMQAVEQRVQRRARRRRWVVAAGSLAAAAALVIGVATLRETSPSVAAPVAGRVEIKPEARVLADGSRIELKAGAEVAVDFSAAHRSVRLVRGEAHFAVAKDASRPFVVHAGEVTVRAVGTEFAVRFEPAAVDVLVTEGRVAVRRLDPEANPDAPDTVAPTLLEAGAKTVVPLVAAIAPLEVRSLAPDQIESALAWRRMRVEFTATPLAEIVARFNRLNLVQLALAEPGLGSLRISGIFWLDDPGGFARLVESSAGLRTAKEAGDRIVLARP